MQWQESDFVAKVEIPLPRATPPASTLVADTHAMVGEGMWRRECRIETHKMLEPRMCDGASGFFVQSEGAAASRRSATTRTNTTSHPPNDKCSWQRMFHLEMRFKIREITFSFSLGSLPATRIVSAVSAEGVSLEVFKIPPCFKSHTKAKAPERLFPSVNG